MLMVKKELLCCKSYCNRYNLGHIIE